MTKPSLTIIGFGIMGQEFARYLKPYFNVLVANRSDKSSIARKLKVKFTLDIKNSINQADYVLVCVPMDRFKPIIQKIKPNLTRKQTLMDVCSVKEMPVSIMKKLPCNYIATHPLFGPTKSFKGRKIILWPKTNEKRFKFIKKTFETIGKKPTQ